MTLFVINSLQPKLAIENQQESKENIEKSGLMIVSN